MLKSKSKNLANAFDLLTSMPEDFRVAGREDTKAQNDATKSRIITPVEQSWHDWFESEGISNDFMNDRQQEPDSTRRG
jgi:virulence-associated protein VagC